MLAATCGRPSAQVRVELKAGMLLTSDAIAAPLYQNCPDADLLKTGLTMESSTPHKWVADVEEPFLLHASCEASKQECQALLTVWNWENQPVSEFVFSLPFSEVIAFRVEGRGTYLLTLDLVREERTLERLVRSFSVCPPNEDRRAQWREKGFYLGTCSFPGRQHWTNTFGPAMCPGLSEQETRLLDAQLSARLGLQVVRPDLHADWTEENQPVDFTRTDEAIHAWTDQGFDLDLQIGRPGDWSILPAYADVTDPQWRYPKKEVPSRKYAAACIERYAEHAAFAELYNEPDNKDFWRGTPEEYVDWVNWMLEEKERVGPDVPVLNGGYCLIEPEWMGYYIREFKGLLDGVAYHSHGDVIALKQVFAAMRAAHAAAGIERPVYHNTEMGYAAWRLDMERHQAATTIQKAIYCRAHDHRGVLFYCSRDVGGPRQRPGNPDWGGIDHFMCPRFVYGAISALVDWYAEATFERILGESQHLNAYLFKSPDGLTLCAFVPHPGTTSFSLESDAMEVKKVDPMGNVVPLGEELDNLSATFYPTTFLLQGATEAKIEAQ